MATMSATMKQFTKGLITAMEPMQASLANIEQSLVVSVSKEDIVEENRAEKVKLNEEKRQTSLLEKIFGKKEKDDKKEGSFLSRHWGKILAAGLFLLPKEWWISTFKGLKSFGKEIKKFWDEHTLEEIGATIAGGFLLAWGTKKIAETIGGVLVTAFIASWVSSKAVKTMLKNAGVVPPLNKNVTGTKDKGVTGTKGKTGTTGKGGKGGFFGMPFWGKGGKADGPTKKDLKMPKAGSGRWMPLLGTAGRILGWSWMLFSVFKAGEEYVKTGSFKEAFGEFWETLFGGMLGDKQAVSGALSSIEESIKESLVEFQQGIIGLINYDWEGEIEKQKVIISKALKNPVGENDLDAAQAQVDYITAIEPSNRTKRQKQNLVAAQKILGQVPEPVKVGSDEEQKERLRINIENAEKRKESAEKDYWNNPSNKKKLNILEEAQETLKQAKANLKGYGVGVDLQKSTMGHRARAPLTQMTRGESAKKAAAYDTDMAKALAKAQKEGSFKKADLEWYRKGASSSALNWLDGIVPLASGTVVPTSGKSTDKKKTTKNESNINAPKESTKEDSLKEGSFKKADLGWYRKGASSSALKNLQVVNGIVSFKESSLIKDDGVIKLSIQNPLSRSSLITMGGGTRAESFEKLNDSTKIKTNLLASIFERKGGLRMTSGYRTEDISNDAMLHGPNDLSLYKSKWTNQGAGHPLTLTEAELTGKEGSDARQRGIEKMRLAGFSSQHEHGNAIDFSWPEGYNKNFDLIKGDIEATFPGAKLLKEKKHLHLAFNPKNDPKDIMDNFSNTHDNYLLAKNNGGVMKGGDVYNINAGTNHTTHPMTVALPEGAIDKKVSGFEKFTL